MKTVIPSSKADGTFLIQEKCFSIFLHQYAQIKEADEMMKISTLISNGQNGEMGFWTGWGGHNCKIKSLYKKDNILWHLSVIYSDLGLLT